MDVIFFTFALVALTVLTTLCLFVIEYQNSRTRRLNKIWSSRLGGLTSPQRPSGELREEQHAA